MECFLFLDYLYDSKDAVITEDNIKEDRHDAVISLQFDHIRHHSRSSGFSGLYNDSGICAMNPDWPDAWSKIAKRRFYDTVVAQ